jgi:hypothetical protein
MDKSGYPLLTAVLLGRIALIWRHHWVPLCYMGLHAQIQEVAKIASAKEYRCLEAPKASADPAT